MSDLGYESVYTKRPSLKESSRSGRFKKDGCGTFFLKNRFELVEHEEANFCDVHDRVGSVTLLRDLSVTPREGGEDRPLTSSAPDFVLVVNTHLYWDGTCVDVQVEELRELELFVRPVLEGALARVDGQESRLALVMCGDFNNTPTSAVYEHMQKEFLVRAGWNLTSAYSFLPLHGGDGTQRGEPSFTSLTNTRSHTIDYVWFSAKSLSPRSLLSIPDSELIREQMEGDWATAFNASADASLADTRKVTAATTRGGIPSSRHASDHLPLYVVFGSAL